MVRKIVFHSIVQVAAATFICLGSGFQAVALEQHQNIQGLFRTSRDVTVKCLECHQQQAQEVLHSSHWTWIREREINGNRVQFGKKDSLAGFTIDVSSNPGRCMICHVSNSLPENGFANPTSDMVDCLVCHDTTGQYRRNVDTRTLEPDQSELPDLTFMARQVGTPSPRNCTVCHFADCGLGASSMQEQDRGTDVHLNSSGPVFTCQTCHPETSGHSFARRMPLSDASESTGNGCASCHTSTPHTPERLNGHAATISCQACHIPEYSTNKPALIGWNWIMTGKTNTVFQYGRHNRVQIHDQNGFWSGSDIEPVYLWDDGSDLVYSRGQRIQPNELTFLQKPAEKGPRSKLTPFRIVYGTQLYDAKYRYLISPLLYPTGSVLFPGSDWDTIARDGMKAIILPYSGQYGFAPTAAYRRINHGVTPAARALDCLDCHGSQGRLQWSALGFDRDPWLDQPMDTTETGPGADYGNTPDSGPLPPIPEPVGPAGPSL